MSEFTMPSAEARAQSAELDSVCRELEKQAEARQAAEMRAQATRECLTDMHLWVKAALECETWNWDPDQHEAATDCANEAKALLAEPSAGEAAIQAKLDQLITASRALRIAVGGEAAGDEPDVYADHDRLCALLADCRRAEDASPQACLEDLRAHIRHVTANEIADLLEGLQAISRIKDLNVVSNVRAYGKKTTSDTTKGA